MQDNTTERADCVDGMPEDVHSKSWQHIDSVMRFSGKGADRRGDAGVKIYFVFVKRSLLFSGS